jgi:hypothetical protein
MAPFEFLPLLPLEMMDSEGQGTMDLSSCGCFDNGYRNLSGLMMEMMGTIAATTAEEEGGATCCSGLSNGFFAVVSFCFDWRFRRNDEQSSPPLKNSCPLGLSIDKPHNELAYRLNDSGFFIGCLYVP